MPSPIDVLKGVFGYPSFRSGQEEIVNEALSGRDVFGIMPTGAGKSVCYQIPAIINGGVSVVISPLISLMKDQVDSLRQNGVCAEAINSSLSWGSVLDIFRAVREGAVKLLYVAPERLDGNGFREFLSSIDVSMVIVDEAHCVSQWGHDFRPSYLNIAPAISSMRRRPVMAAFTATATEEVRGDIVRQLALESPFTIITGFDRENLFFQVESPADKMSFLMGYVKKFPELPGIVYCSTRKAVDEVCGNLRANGVKAVRYHAGLDDAERLKNQDAFIRDRAAVIAATNAFGMGIDKSNVRYVIHYNMPGSIDSYYQEAGRAGRDGSPADCILLFGKGDISTARYLISQGNDEDARKAGYSKLRSMIDYCNTPGCLRSYILGYFGERYGKESCGNCGNCLSTADRTDITIEAQKILSCVYRMEIQASGLKFGASIVTDVLKGSRGKRILSHGFEKISTWGLMKDYGANAIYDMINFLIAENYLAEDEGEFPTLSFTERTFPFLKSKERLVMRKHESKPTRKRSVERGISGAENEALFEELRALRKSIAREEGVPPYVVFSDSTLEAMCRILPSGKEDFLSVPGVGSVKLEKYGDAFLSVIKNST
ncbi:MAG: DNA helicase RecQ [Synergistaceae bacterium]|jgi:ATP-dependent DNA helicase RecQ|nr:DNA helicase RecQ [Synergistaceae bacterium]